MERHSDIVGNKDDAAACKRLRLHVLASGSKGNCSVVEDCSTSACIVIDCGITKRAFFERAGECGVDVSRVGAIFVSHEHTDHTKGLGVVTRGLARIGAHPTVYTSDAIYNASRDLQEVKDAVDLNGFASASALDVGGIGIWPFRTSHDTAESFGFRIECAGDVVGFMTDTGIVTDEAREALAGCRILAIECNHDLDMLESTDYPAYVKARIASKRGHLSNEQASEFVRDMLDDTLECVIGMHVSQNANTYRLARESLTAMLACEGHGAKALAAFQDRAVSV